jgi:carbon storage regulator
LLVVASCNGGGRIQAGSAWIKADRVISDANDLRPVFSNNKARRCLVLVLSRKANQEICIGDDIRVMVIEIRGDKVRLGVTAPRDTSVHRHEIYDAIKQVIESNDSDCD